MKKYYVYSLNDNGVPFYVGKGTGRRMKIHEWNVKNGNLPNGSNKHLFNKIRKTDNIEYKIEFESNDENKCYEMEIKLINSIGIENLCNLTYGGDGLKATDEVKEKISKSLKGYKHSKETIEKMKNKRHSTETKKLISEKTKLALKNKDIRKKMSESKLGKSNLSVLGKDSRKDYSCLTCNKEIKSYSERKFCSVECRTNYNMTTSKCLVCNTDFKHKQYRKRIYCSNKCQRTRLYENTISKV